MKNKLYLLYLYRIKEKKIKIFFLIFVIFSSSLLYLNKKNKTQNLSYLLSYDEFLLKKEAYIYDKNTKLNNL